MLYGRPGCHLCDDARAMLERVRADASRSSSWSATSSDDDALLRRYLERIPVIEIDGEEAFELSSTRPSCGR